MPGARDGQLRIRRGADSPPWALQMFDDELGLWLTLAQVDEEEDAMRAGIPILRGPYIVDFGDIPTDGSTKALWTPDAGDVVLGIWADPPQVTPWDYGHIAINQGSEADYSFEAPAQFIGVTYSHALTPGVPVQVRLVNPTDPAPGVGHLVLYALVARAVAP